MRNYITFLLSVIISFQLYSQESKISGTIKNYYGNDSLTVVIFGSQNPSEHKIPVSKKGEFSFSYTSNGTNFIKIYFTAQDFILSILAPHETLLITADYQDLSKSYTIKGPKDAELIQKNNQVLLSYVEQMNQRQIAFKQEIDSLEKEKNQYILSTIRNNPSSLSALTLIDMVDIKEHPEIYALIDSSLMKAYPNNIVVQNFHTNLNQMTHLQIGSQIPQVVLNDEHGNSVSLDSYRGKTVLLVFWATWCRPCLQEIPHIKDAYEKYHTKGFDVLSVSTDNDIARWKTFVAEQPVPWTTTHDSDKKYSQLFQVTGIPFTILIDAHGKIIAKNVRGGTLLEYLQQIYQ
ncbi:MAG: TlpA family protein disulfide reductase [Bacteroidales bacterium]|nr:TlpA family protein disulfide reductase [Bacteroidales bacterium]NLK81581.1 AhpC/TSA family protein [Bacteroidales bacterium]HPY81727.1 TlpA disulfide reductase family protein [Bacteroidales bacterium]